MRSMETLTVFGLKQLKVLESVSMGEKGDKKDIFSVISVFKSV